VTEKPSADPLTAAAPWWRSAVVYQIYLRSYADADGDGIGDLAGLRARLDHLSALGVDALWIGPWYPSPMADGGYDVADYRAIDPLFGTLDDARALVADAHARGLRVILDLVANHSSDRHPWFRAALAAPPGAPERERYLFRDGRGPGGAAPPNDWPSVFGGPAWTRVTEPDGRPGQWYLHLFDAAQPDFNWGSDDVAREFDDIIRFWLDLGLDGLRVDAAPAFVKDPSLRDFGAVPDGAFAPAHWNDVPFWDLDGVHAIFRRWRAITDGYDGDRVLVGEIIVNGAERLARYLRPGHLHQAFNADYLKAPWDATELRATIDATLATLAGVGAPATWVLSNHDETRHLTRYGRRDTAAGLPGTPQDEPPDLALGTRRARAAALLMLALPGSVYVYQGEELGLWEVEDLPDDVLQDPMWTRTGGAVRGRDGCRVPLPWAGDRPPFGFGPDGAWLPQPAAWRALTAAAQERDAGSMLNLYRNAIALRRRLDTGADGAPLRWNAAPPGVLDFTRGAAGWRCVANLSGAPHAVGAAEPLLASAPLRDGTLLPDACVWLAQP
jgi:alpha-glucosidase